MEVQGGQNGGPGGALGAQGEAQILGGKKRAPEGSLFRAFLVILGAFWESKKDEQSCFFRTSIFY